MTPYIWPFLKDIVIFVSNIDWSVTELNGWTLTVFMNGLKGFLFH